MGRALHLAQLGGDAGGLEGLGVPTELSEVKGAPHGYDLVDDSPTAMAVYKDRMVAIQKFFAQG